MRKKLLRGLLCLLLALALAVGGYVIYVFAAYYRVEDNQILEVQTIHDYGLDRELRTAGGRAGPGPRRRCGKT